MKVRDRFAVSSAQNCKCSSDLKTSKKKIHILLFLILITPYPRPFFVIVSHPPRPKKKFLQKIDVGQIRTDALEGTRFLVLRDNHSATTPDDGRFGEGWNELFWSFVLENCTFVGFLALT